MKKLLILSGKGGTGKTTTAAAFIRFAAARAFADCDVDAPNLHLVTAAGGEPVFMTDDGSTPQFGAANDRVFLQGRDLDALPQALELLRDRKSTGKVVVRGQP